MLKTDERVTHKGNMNQEIVKENFLHLPQEKIDLLKRTVCVNATDDEFELFLHVCRSTGLDPFLKQIYAIKRHTKNGPSMTIQTSIDGMRLIADRTGNYAPGKDPHFEYDENKQLVSATSFIKKRTVDGTWHEICAVAHMSEYKPISREPKPIFSNNFWDRMPHIMLAKCAESMALRKAFPAEMSAIYSKEEMEQADEKKEPIEVKTNDIPEETILELIKLSFESPEVAKKILKFLEISSFLKINESPKTVDSHYLERIIFSLKNDGAKK